MFGGFAIGTLIYLYMQYSEERISFFDGDIKINYDFISDGGGNRMYIDVTRKYNNGDVRLTRMTPEDFIEDYFTYYRYRIDTAKSVKTKVQLAISAKYMITKEVREIERAIRDSKKEISLPDFNALKDEAQILYEGYKDNYASLWWRVKLPTVLSVLAFILSVVLAIDKYTGWLPIRTTN
jgi:hypothetical protein